MSDARKMIMTDGTLVNINTYIDLDGVVLNGGYRSLKRGIVQDILNKISTNGQYSSRYNFFVENYLYKIDNSNFKGSPVSCNIIAHYPTSGEGIYIAYVIQIPGYDIYIYSDDTVESRPYTAPMSEDCIILSNANFTDLSLMRNCFLQNKAPKFFDNTNKYMYLCSSYIAIPQGSTPTAMSLFNIIYDSRYNATTYNVTFFFDSNHTISVTVTNGNVVSVSHSA